MSKKNPKIFQQDWSGYNPDPVEVHPELKKTDATINRGNANRRRAKDPEWLKRSTKKNQEINGSPVEVYTPSGEYKKYPSIGEAGRDLKWGTLNSANHEMNFPKNGSWRIHGLARKGYYTRRIIKGSKRPPLPEHGFRHKLRTIYPQIKAPKGKWITYNGCREASEKLGWGVLVADTKKYFPADGSIYTQRLGAKKGWSTRRKLGG